jgi:hypothetical protein
VPLTPIEPPEELFDAVVRHVGQMAMASLPTLNGVERDHLALVAPHRMYTLGIDAILGKRLEEAEFAGWRFLVADNRRVVASAEVFGEAEQIPSLDSGPYVQSMVEAIDKLDTRPEIAGGQYELRLLKVLALYVVAAWLVDGSRAVVPLTPAPRWLDAGTWYSEEEFVAALKGPARSSWRAPAETQLRHLWALKRVISGCTTYCRVRLDWRKVSVHVCSHRH